MEGKNTQPMKKGKCTLPPKRGQIKAKIAEELVEKVVTVARASGTGNFYGCGGSSSQAFGYSSDEKKNVGEKGKND